MNLICRVYKERVNAQEGECEVAYSMGVIEQGRRVGGRDGWHRVAL